MLGYEHFDPACVRGFVEIHLEKIGEGNLEGEDLLRGDWEGDPEVVLEDLKVAINTGRAAG